MENQTTQVNSFIEDTQLASDIFGQLVIRLRELVYAVAPNPEQEIKYGGLVFIAAGQLVCGIFVYKKHISLEFSQGASLTDPDALLEGKGQLRRHLKLRTAADIEAKKVAYYLAQTWS